MPFQSKIIIILFKDDRDTFLKPLQLCLKSIAITPQFHRFYILIALSLFFKFYIPTKSLLCFLQNDVPLPSSLSTSFKRLRKNLRGYVIDVLQ